MEFPVPAHANSGANEKLSVEENKISLIIVRE
jgi:hypothetical protein